MLRCSALSQSMSAACESGGVTGFIDMRSRPLAKVVGTRPRARVPSPVTFYSRLEPSVYKLLIKWKRACPDDMVELRLDESQSTERKSDEGRP